eukprot:1158230-Pelagomonas_calceolata.AAC.4
MVFVWSSYSKRDNHLGGAVGDLKQIGCATNKKGLKSALSSSNGSTPKASQTATSGTCGMSNFKGMYESGLSI